MMTLLATTATIALVSSASALEAQAFLDRFSAVYKSTGHEFTFTGAQLNGDTVTVTGGSVTMVMPDGSSEEMQFDTPVTFSGVAENADGSYTAKSVTIPDIDTDFDAETKGHISIRDIRLDGLYLPAGDTLSPLDSLQLLQAASIGPIAISADGKQIVSIDSIQSTASFNPAQGSPALVDVTSRFNVAGFKLDLSSVKDEDPASGEMLAALGITTITGAIDGSLSWTMADGHMVVDQFKFDFADLGALDVNADLTGLTPAVMEQLSEMQMAMGGSGTTSEEQAQAQMMSSMAIMQGVSIVGASVRYDDASLAGKLLELFAQQSGADRATFVTGLQAMLPETINQMGIPALAELIVAPASAFLDDPQSLELRIAPASPTSLLVLMAGAANPAGLIKVLNLTLAANQ
ncbi:MAG TPA: hypothetical protein VLZ53_02380 [Devosia sp.]|nr:hypothetical protein [Devosia sp.]